MLKIDYCNIAAARFATTHYHYSRSMPAGKTVKIGVWEDDKFVGCVIFSRGATPHIGSPYGLEQTAVCELTRVALKRGHQTETTKVISEALFILKRDNPGLRLVVSYADKDQGHTGTIYRAGNWIYEGLFKEGTVSGFMIKGKKVHPRTLDRYGEGAQSLKWVRANLDPEATECIASGKHKYLMPLDKKMRRVIEQRRVAFSG